MNRNETAARPKLITNAYVGFVDIVASTDLLNAQGTAADFEMMEAFVFSVTKRARINGVRILNSTGDGFFFMLEDAEDRPERMGSFVSDLTHDFRLLLLSLGERAKLVESGLRFGIARGNVLSGEVRGCGSSNTLVVGPAVNLASRLCAVAARNELAVCKSTFRDLNPGFSTKPVSMKFYRCLKGFHASVESYHMQIDPAALDVDAVAS